MWAGWRMYRSDTIWHICTINVNSPSCWNPLCFLELHDLLSLHEDALMPDLFILFSPLSSSAVLAWILHKHFWSTKVFTYTSLIHSPRPPACGVNNRLSAATWTVSFRHSTLDQMNLKSGHCITTDRTHNGAGQRLELRKALVTLYPDALGAFSWTHEIFLPVRDAALCGLWSLVLLICKERQRWNKSNFLCNSLYWSK